MQYEVENEQIGGGAMTYELVAFSKITAIIPLLPRDESGNLHPIMTF